PDALRAARRENAFQSRGNLADCIFPCDRLEPCRALRPDPLQGPRQAHFRVDPGTVIGDGALAAERAAAHRMVGIAQYLDLAVLAFRNGDSASVVAIARAGCANDLRWRHCSISWVVVAKSGE